jgi:glyoxylase-like metal-dependent hydrolase (beta-lactamase superfamily II)
MCPQKRLCQIADKIFQINIPHFYDKFVNVYVLISDTVTLVDTGHSHGSSFECLERIIRHLGYELTDVGHIIYTHPHIDHCGGGWAIKRLNPKVINIAFSAAIGIFARFIPFLDNLLSNANDFFDTKAKGAPHLLIKQSKKFFGDYNNAVDLSQEGLVINRPVKDSDRVSIGDLELRVIHTPSHTPWDISLYEPSKGLLFTGDFIVEKGIPLLSDITGSDVDKYIQSLHQVQKIKLKVLLPGHGRIIHHPVHHIEAALSNILSYEEMIVDILKDKASTLVHITNVIIREKLDDYNLWYHSLGVADSILTKLMREGKVTQEVKGGKNYYSLWRQGA